MPAAAGQYLAAHESLLDFGARFYDPAAAIFLQQDPLAEKYYNISPYAYCANNPVNFVDPDGKQDHQQKVQELNSKALGEANNDETVLIEKKIQIEGSNRRPDVQIIDKDNRTRKIFEAERHPESKRNRMREEEYKRLSIEYETHSLK